MTSRPRPSLIVNPADDPEFAAAVDQEQVMSGSPAELEGRLRDRYPAVRVRPRDLAGEPEDTWYVYRDGRWSPTGT